MSKVTIKSIVAILETSPTKFLRADDLALSLGLTTAPADIHMVLDVVERGEEFYTDNEDMRPAWCPTIVAHRRRASHGIDFVAEELPPAPRTSNRGRPANPDAKAQKNYIPVVRLIPASEWDKYHGSDALVASLTTQVMRTLANLPDNCRVNFGDISSVKPSPMPGFALVTLQVRCTE